jgi:hypothetical protein
MSKEVRFVVGEGDNEHEFGVAELSPIDNGHMMINLRITDAKMAMILGGNDIKGVVSRTVTEHPILDGLEDPVDE